MRRFLLRATVGCAAFVAGVIVGSIHQHLVQSRALTNIAQGIPTEAALQSSHDTPSFSADENFPENKSLSPYEIEYFIGQHAQANLTRLFERLNVRGNGGYPIESSFYWQCGNCKAESFSYNLDDDAHGEVVLRIADGMAESYRYLIFKDRAYNDTPLLGHIDAWGKYRPSTHVVLLSGGKAWLVVETQAANGSGLSAYVHTIYQVSPRGVKPAVSYFSEINQSGFSRFPSKRIVAQPVSCEVKGGRLKAMVSYTVEYSLHTGNHETTLFTKHQTAVLTGADGGGPTRLDTSLSNITKHEFETVFNFDSMGDKEFLNYNSSELHAIAVGRDATKKEWLKGYLDTCEDGSIKRELLSLLR